MQFIALLNLLVPLIENLSGKIADSIAHKEISVEEQAKLKLTYVKLKASLDVAFTGPEWEIKPDKPDPDPSADIK